MTNARNPILLSVIITAHSEGILIHRTLASVKRALAQLSNPSYEIIIHADNPTEATRDYLETHKSTSLKDVIIFNNSFGDLGLSRNFAIKRAQGKYIATIDADDLMSENWLSLSITTLESREEVTIAHSEVTVEFEGANSLVIKHGEIDHDTDTLLAVYANRWNSVIVAPKSLMIENPYTPNSPGFGYEDWHFNARMIDLDVHNVLIPETAIFVRRKKSNSEWSRQINSMAVLRANPALSFDSIRKVKDVFAEIVQPTLSFKTSSSTKESLKVIVKKNHYIHRGAKKIQALLRKINTHVAPTLSPRAYKVPQWLLSEWKGLHAIDRQIFPSKNTLQTLSVYDTLTYDHKLAGHLYKKIVDQLSRNSYQYLIFAPWLTKGGADKYTIDYANTIAALKKRWNVLIVTTLPVESPWKDKLTEGVDLLEFGRITDGAPNHIKNRLMEHLIENGGIEVLHIINSEFGYDFTTSHDSYIRSSSKKVLVTSFSESVDKEGKLHGYSHTHVPEVYSLASLITSDNQAVMNTWQKEYGFDKRKLAVHRQPIDLTKVAQVKKDYVQAKPFRILWAARIAPEKLPEKALDIARRLDGFAIIDMFGTVDDELQATLDSLPKNVTYKGPFNGFSSLPVNDYDAFLYTSLFDGMPNTILEAASAGIPIVASAVGGIAEFIKNLETGLLVKDYLNTDEYVEALLQLIDTPTLGRTLAANAKKKIQTEYSSSQYTKAVKEMIRKIST